MCVDYLRLLSLDLANIAEMAVQFEAVLRSDIPNENGARQIERGLAHGHSDWEKHLFVTDGRIGRI